MANEVTPASPPAATGSTADSELDYLTNDDRELIHAVTGETIIPGQRPQDRPVSAFAMQLAVDRKNGGLRAGIEVGGGYLRRTNRLLLRLNVPSNPFSGELLARALRFVDERTGGRLGTGPAEQPAPAPQAVTVAQDPPEQAPTAEQVADPVAGVDQVPQEQRPSADGPESAESGA